MVNLLIYVLPLKIQLSREGDRDPIIKRGGSGSNYQERGIGIQLSREGD
jgi:hypothetical protein